MRPLLAPWPALHIPNSPCSVLPNYNLLKNYQLLTASYHLPLGCSFCYRLTRSVRTVSPSKTHFGLVSPKSPPKVTLLFINLSPAIHIRDTINYSSFRSIQQETFGNQPHTPTPWLTVPLLIFTCRITLPPYHFRKYG